MKNLVLVLAITLLSNIAFASKRYVTQSGSGNYSGSSWGNAANDLQAMINNSLAGDEVWVKSGTYYPTTYPVGCTNCTSTRDYTFSMKDEVKVYGQFAGNEFNINQRILGQGESILSGDLTNDGITTNNAYHVVSFVNISLPTTILDGFTIRNGNANINSSISSSPNAELRTYNRNWGGGLLFIFSHGLVENCKIISNYATYGGGMLASGNSSRPEIRNSIFVSNAATEGAGIYNHEGAFPTIEYATIVNNLATSAGGGINNYLSNPIIRSTIIWNNNSPILSGIANNGGTPVVSYSIVQNGNSPCTSCPNTNGNIDPLFMNILDSNGTDNIWGSIDDGLQLSLNSPALEVAFSPNVAGTDIAGQPRFFDNPLRYSHPTAFSDIGAYENQNINPIVIYVNGSLASGLNNGTSWANAFRGATALQNALMESKEGNSIWVAAGIYKPTSYPVGCIGCSSNRDYTFHIKDGVKMYGGFLGNETNINQRNFATTETILSGDINTIDLATDNVSHVVLSINDRELTAIDGFTIKNGGDFGSYSVEPYLNVESSSFTNVLKTNGGGLYASGSKINLSNNRFVNNNSRSGGGIYYVNSFFSRFNSCTFLNNSAIVDGGAFYSSSNDDIEFSKCVFKSNRAYIGGGLYDLSSDFKMTNCIFNNNIGEVYYSALYSCCSSPSIINCTIVDNINLSISPVRPTVSFRNCTNAVIKNSIIWASTGGASIDYFEGNPPNISNSIIEGGYTPCTSCPNTNGDINPSLAIESDGDGQDDVWGSYDDGFNITSNSPARNAGTNVSAPPLDFVGNTATGANKDIGAYAYKAFSNCLNNALIVDRPQASGNFQAVYKITSVANIPAANSVSLETTQQILLLPGFKAENGAVFTAKIGENCLLGLE